jgi:membrane protein YqaA with SNARE-associated domain
MSETAASVRPGPLRRLYHWILRNAEGPYAYSALAAVSFAEASFFPLIPDVVMAPMVLANRRRMLQIALWCTAWSVIGGAFGYAIGSVFYHSIGQWLVSLLGMSAEIDTLRDRFAQNSWVILVFGLFTPFKLVSISAGIAAVPFPLFILYTSITRSIRFFAVGGLLYYFGDPVRNFLERWLEHVIVGVFVLVVVLIVVLRYALHFL